MKRLILLSAIVLLVTSCDIVYFNYLSPFSGSWQESGSSRTWDFDQHTVKVTTSGSSESCDYSYDYWHVTLSLSFISGTYATKFTDDKQQLIIWDGISRYDLFRK
jgi:hypothetical protein